MVMVVTHAPHQRFQAHCHLKTSDTYTLTNAINNPRKKRRLLPSISPTSVKVQAAAASEASNIQASRQLAALRALETETVNHTPLIADGFAKALLENLSPDQIANIDDDDALFDLIATAFIDGQLLQALSLVNMQRKLEYNQCVIVGDGFDTRPFRLLLAEGTTIFLVAAAEVHERAEAILAQEGARVPRGCLLRRVNADIQAGVGFSDALQRAGFRGDRLSVWVLQGTERLQLSDTAVNAIMTDASNLAALESVIIGELRPTTRDKVNNLLASYGMLGGAVDLQTEMEYNERNAAMLNRWRESDTRRWLFMAQQKRLSLAEIDTYESHVAAAEEVDEDFFVEDKLKFVSGHSGTSVIEIIYITIVPVLLLTSSRILLWVWSPTGRTRGVLEAFMLVVPQVLGLLNVISPGWLVFILSLATFVILFIDYRAASKRRNSTEPRSLDMRCAFAAYRASLMIITCISILGVDFPAFPRRYAKAETFGTGLMDAGVGSIIMASAIVHGWQVAAGISLHGHNLWKEFTRLSALLTIGISRVVFVLLSGYQNHVGEYGVHWNFFLTIAAIRILQLMLPKAFKTSGVRAGTLGLAILILYQIALSWFGLVDFIHSDEARGTDLFTQNKEGIISVIGYFSMSLLGIGCGAVLHHLSLGSLPSDIHWKKRVYGSRSGSKTTLELLWGNGIIKSLWVLAVLWLSYYSAAHGIQNVSRRACNAAYVLWMLALGFQCTLMFIAVEITAEGRPLPELLWNINMSMLPVFLVGNVLTGLVNMSIDTLNTPKPMAVAIVSSYMITLCGAAAALKAFTARFMKSRSL